jgi:cellulose synthase/poly-beta-1,6-N-acetylglucosamine synthase-like glycosyltransferase
MEFTIFQAILYVFLYVALFFQIVLLTSFFEGTSKMKAEEIASEPTYFPTVAIAVPVWNEESTLAGTLNSLLALRYPKDKLEIIVIDDGSTDNTLSIARSFESNPQIKVITKQNGGKHTAVNLALSMTHSELFGCLDADSFVDSEALVTIVKYFEQPDTMAVTPAMKVFTPKTLIQKLQSVEYTMGIFLKRVFGNLNSIQVTPGPFSVFRKKVFDDLGPYKKAHNTEDLEIALRMHLHHYKIVNAHKAFVFTKTPSTLRALLKQRLRWTQGSIQNMLDYREMFFKREFGNFGLFILPIIFFFILATLYSTSFIVVNLFKSLVRQIEYIMVAGFNPEHYKWKFDPYFISTEALGFIAVLFIIISLVLFRYGRQISEEKTNPIHFVYFLIMYGCIAPIWVWQSVYNIVMKKTNSWR